jgi:hypothetical protein
MSLAEVMEELPRLSFEERQLLIRRAIELDDPPLSETDEAVIDERLAGHHQDPSSPISLEALKVRIREQFGGRSELAGNPVRQATAGQA